MREEQTLPEMPGRILPSYSTNNARIVRDNELIEYRNQAFAAGRAEASKDLLVLLAEARKDLPIAAASWNEELDETAAFHVPRVLDLIKRIDAVLPTPPAAMPNKDQK